MVDLSAIFAGDVVAQLGAHHVVLGQGGVGEVLVDEPIRGPCWHAATMVAAGVYMVVKVFWLFAWSPEALQVIAWIGGITAFLAASIALVQRDIKKILGGNLMRVWRAAEAFAEGAG